MVALEKPLPFFQRPLYRRLRRSIPLIVELMQQFSLAIQIPAARKSWSNRVCESPPTLVSLLPKPDSIPRSKLFLILRDRPTASGTDIVWDRTGRRRDQFAI